MDIFLRAKLEENCELQGTDYVSGQISEHISFLKPNRDLYCVYYRLSIFSNVHLGNIQSGDVLRPITYKTV